MAVVQHETHPLEMRDRKMSLSGQELFACLERDHRKRSRDEEKKKPAPKEARKA